MWRHFVLVSLLVLAGCAQLNDLNNALYSDPREEDAKTQRIFDQQKAAIENEAMSKRITWLDAARRVRDLDRSFAGRGTWHFNSNDEEYHAYCIALAEQVDAGRLSPSQYDAMRTRRFNEIQRRR